MKTSKELDIIFHALADSTRRDILTRLASEDFSIKELADKYEMTLAAVSKHIKVLERACFLETTKEGRVHRCKMNFEPFSAVEKQVNEYKQFWENRFDALEEFLEKNKSKIKRKRKND